MSQSARLGGSYLAALPREQLIGGEQLDGVIGCPSRRADSKTALRKTTFLHHKSKALSALRYLIIYAAAARVVSHVLLQSSHVPLTVSLFACMADPLSATSALVGLIAFSYQASKALHDTIKSFRQHPKYVRDLKDELSTLEGVLLLLEQSLTTSGAEDYHAIEYPIGRCGRACEEFQQALQKCLGRDDGDTSSFRGWLKIRWMGSDIHGFRDTLAGYKSTIAIAMAGVNL